MSSAARSASCAGYTPGTRSPDPDRHVEGGWLPQSAEAVGATAYLAFVAFDVSADSYGRFMGRYSRPLATAFVELVKARPDQRILDVGCGPGALTTELADRFGARGLYAADPSELFVHALQRRCAGAFVVRAVAEKLPFADESFDLTLAQLVVPFMTDPVAGLRDMARVTRPGGTVAASVWHRGPLSTFWRAVHELDPSEDSESHLAGVAEGELAGLFAAADMPEASSSVLTVHVSHATFEDWWHPFTLGVGPAGDYVAKLDEDRCRELAGHCRRLQPHGPFTVEAAAWTVTWQRPAATTATGA